jgi:hypothetical protein
VSTGAANKKKLGAAKRIGSRVLSTVAVAPPSLFAVPALPDDAAHHAHLAAKWEGRNGDDVLWWVAPIFLYPPRPSTPLGTP